jgi:hypothetical protein
MRSTFVGYLSFLLGGVMLALTFLVVYNSYGIDELPPIVIGLGTIVAVVVLILALSFSR